MRGRGLAGNKSTLYGITWDHPRGYLPLEASCERYWKHQGVRVLWERRSLKDFGDMPVKLLAEKYDLLVIDHPHMGTAANDDCLLRLDEVMGKEALDLLSAQSVGPSFASYHYAGHQWALPVDAACQVAAYRPDLIENMLPRTWEEVFSLAQELSHKGIFIGMALCPTDCSCTFLTLSAQCKEGPREPEGNHTEEKHAAEQRGAVLIKPETGRWILERMLQLKKVIHPASINWNPINLYDYMADNKDIGYSPLAFGYVNYASIGGEDGLKYTGIPGGSGALLGGAGIAISARCKDVSAAVEYIKWVCDPQYQKTNYLTEGGQPAQLDSWTDEQADQYAGGFFSGTLATMRQAYRRPRMAGWPEFQEYLGEVVHDFLILEKSADETIAKINRVYRDMFGAK